MKSFSNKIKAQLSLEFGTYSILFFIVLGIVLALVFSIGGRQVEISKGEALEVKLRSFASTITLVNSLRESGNFEYTLILERTVLGYPYRIEVTPTAVTLMLEDSEQTTLRTVIPRVVLLDRNGNQLSSIEISSQQGQVTFIANESGIIIE